MRQDARERENNEFDEFDEFAPRGDSDARGVFEPRIVARFPKLTDGEEPPRRAKRRLGGIFWRVSVLTLVFSLGFFCSSLLRSKSSSPTPGDAPVASREADSLESESAVEKFSFDADALVSATSAYEYDGDSLYGSLYETPETSKPIDREAPILFDASALDSDGFDSPYAIAAPPEEEEAAARAETFPTWSDLEPNRVATTAGANPSQVADYATTRPNEAFLASAEPSEVAAPERRGFEGFQGFQGYGASGAPSSEVAVRDNRADYARNADYANNSAINFEAREGNRVDAPRYADYNDSRRDAEYARDADQNAFARVASPEPEFEEDSKELDEYAGIPTFDNPRPGRAGAVSQSPEYVAQTYEERASQRRRPAPQTKSGRAVRW
ncbi:MAG: hypothetical protein IJM30_06735 [Thermoguttaceae bacterium]|nr:hypothetical protein [Thermoguttaceae bacterium]